MPKKGISPTFQPDGQSSSGQSEVCTTVEGNLLFIAMHVYNTAMGQMHPRRCQLHHDVIKEHQMKPIGCPIPKTLKDRHQAACA